MDVAYADGRKVRVETDGRWEWTDATPIRQATLYHGEQYDATAEEPDWATAKADRSPWRPARVLEDDGLRPVPDMSVPIRLRDPRTPVEIIPLGDDRWILDFGQNRAGLVAFDLTLPRGSRVTIHHAEEIAADRRSLDVRTLRSARQTDEYVFAGRPGGERYIPRFTYHGFRYAEVTGVPTAQMKAENFRAFAVTADVKDTATFRSSDETLNWLFSAAYWSMRSNLVGYPSDCPMRDERTPCLMDSNCFEDTACLFFDMRDYYAKWLGDAVRYQRGVDPKIGDNGNPDWSGEPMLLAERLLTHYAATNAVRREYADLRKLTDSFLERSPSNVWHVGFGDWCPPGGKSWKDYHSSVSLVNTLFLGESCRAMARVAEAVGETADAVRYRARADACRKTFRTTFFDPVRKTYGDGKQTDLALPAFGRQGQGRAGFRVHARKGRDDDLGAVALGGRHELAQSCDEERRRGLSADASGRHPAVRRPEGCPHRYLMLTMDRVNIPSIPGPNWTYGGLHLFVAD